MQKNEKCCCTAMNYVFLNYVFEILISLNVLKKVKVKMFVIAV